MANGGVRVGNMVRLCNLRNATHLNGQPARVIVAPDDCDRVTVIVEGHPSTVRVYRDKLVSSDVSRATDGVSGHVVHDQRCQGGRESDLPRNDDCRPVQSAASISNDGALCGRVPVMDVKGDSESCRASSGHL